VVPVVAALDLDDQVGLIGVLCGGLSGCGSKAAGHEEEVRPVQVITASQKAGMAILVLFFAAGLVLLARIKAE
jgi:hypothetical protein